MLLTELNPTLQEEQVTNDSTGSFELGVLLQLISGIDIGILDIDSLSVSGGNNSVYSDADGFILYAEGYALNYTYAELVLDFDCNCGSDGSHIYYTMDAQAGDCGVNSAIFTLLTISGLELPLNELSISIDTIFTGEFGIVNPYALSGNIDIDIRVKSTQELILKIYGSLILDGINIEALTQNNGNIACSVNSFIISGIIDTINDSKCNISIGIIREVGDIVSGSVLVGNLEVA